MRPLPVCAAVLLGAALVASAAEPDRHGVLLEELTWTEVRARVADGATTVILPVGGTEQSGPHMALGKHNLRAAALSAKIAAQLGNALVAPVIAYVPEGSIDPPSSHMRFPGTISIPVEVFERTLEAAALSFRQHGFRDIVLLGDHGGYQSTLRATAERLNRQWARSATRVHAIEAYYRAAEVSYPRALEQRGFRREEIGTHAGLADTSLTLALAPELVRAGMLEGNVKFGPAEGVYGGDPRRASAELGQIGVDLIVAETVAAIRGAVAQHQQKDVHP
jgi:creatinine amidohydrolase